ERRCRDHFPLGLPDLRLFGTGFFHVLLPCIFCGETAPKGAGRQAGFGQPAGRAMAASWRRFHLGRLAIFGGGIRAAASPLATKPNVARPEVWTRSSHAASPRRPTSMAIAP